MNQEIAVTLEWWAEVFIAVDPSNEEFAAKRQELYFQLIEIVDSMRMGPWLFQKEGKTHIWRLSAYGEATGVGYEEAMRSAVAHEVREWYRTTLGPAQAYFEDDSEGFNGFIRWLGDIMAR